MPIQKQFRYDSNSRKGLFDELRQKSIPYTIESPDFHNSTDFCSLGHLGLEAYAIADGNLETAWRNQLDNNSYFIIDFYYMNFLIKGFTITKDCNTIPSFVILGSNDKQTWTKINTQTGMSANFEYFPIHNNMNNFRYIKFSLVDLNGTFHISELELFGILNYMLTCKKTLFFHYLSSFSMIFLSLS